MKAMLEPRIVAASIQSRAPSQGTRALPDRITASSQGGLMAAIDPSAAATFQVHRGPTCQALPPLRTCSGKTQVGTLSATPPSVHRRTLGGILRAGDRKPRPPDGHACL